VTALTTDEIRVIARLVDGFVPSGLDDVRDDDRDDRVDRVVLRGLRARGLVTGPELELDPTLGPLADALAGDAPDIEVERDGEAGAHRSVVLAAPRTVVLTEDGETGPAVWTMSVADAGTDPVTVVGPLAGLDALDGPAAQGEPFEVAASAHADADDALAAGDHRAAIERLVSAGVAEATATSWIDAVAGRRDAVVVRAGDAELRWLVDAGGGCWEVDIAADREASVCTPAVGPDLRSRVVALVGAGLDGGPSWR
jgi:hypothetical protein